MRGTARLVAVDVVPGVDDDANAALHDDAPGIHFRALFKVIERLGEHAMRVRGCSSERRLARSGEIDSKKRHPLLDVIVGMGREVLLAGVEPRDGENERGRA